MQYLYTSRLCSFGAISLVDVDKKDKKGRWLESISFRSVPNEDGNQKKGVEKVSVGMRRGLSGWLVACLVTGWLDEWVAWVGRWVTMALVEDFARNPSLN